MSRDEILEILKQFKKNCGAQYGILRIGVFGSVARDQASEKSDVDIVVKTETPDPFNIVHIKENLEEQLHLSVDIVRLRDKMNPFLKNRIDQEAFYV
ncbi:MAG: nucleotidyltransferase domain-containing protein [Phycisphaerae bacterium]|nr:nucleotidyltransferase domain-containing protein [Phycisphaerae bacterium]